MQILMQRLIWVVCAGLPHHRHASNQAGVAAEAGTAMPVISRAAISERWFSLTSGGKVGYEQFVDDIYICRGFKSRKMFYKDQNLEVQEQRTRSTLHVLQKAWRVPPSISQMVHSLILFQQPVTPLQP